MLETIVYTSGIAFTILLIAYLINKNKMFWTKSIHTLINHFIEEKKPANKHLSYYAMHFKIGANLKNILFYLIATLIIAFLLYNYIFFAIPVSNSMRPTFEAGDLVLMQSLNTEPHEGDIVMFGMAMIGKDQIITHRVYSISPEGIKTKGDAGPVDTWVLPLERIHAKAVTVGGKPIVIKSIGYYFLEEQISSAYTREFGFMQVLFRGGKQLGLLIFVICLVAYTWISVNDMKRQKKYRRRN